MNIRLILTIFISKSVYRILKIFKFGGGSALPGLIAEYLYPSILKNFSKQIPNVILISGTNGKTTTQTILGSIFDQTGIRYISNKTGANLKRGIIGKFIKESSITGTIHYSHAVFEIEEATMPKIVKDLNPTMIIITNLYRDQLDAYGEVDRTQKFLSESIKSAPNATVILNADDPRVSTLTNGLKNKTLYYGLNKQYIDNFSYEGNDKNIKTKDIEATNIEIMSDLSSKFIVNNTAFHLDSPGKFHIYNALAAISAAKVFELSDKMILDGINSSKSAFGRGENIKKDGINYKILLVKNPVGLSLTLDLLQNTNGSDLILILNDNIADGRDVSWIWDAKMELLQKIKPRSIICSGTRAEDMLLRVKYALEGLVKINTFEYESIKYKTKIILVKDIAKLHTEIKTKNSELNTVFVLPTYTAMLEFRKNILGQALNE